MLIGLVCLFLLTPILVQADYPEREITIYVGAAAGGTTDLGIRILAETVSKEFGKPVVVVNKPGGGQTVASTLVSRAQPDGYTLGAVSATAFVEVPHFRKVPYDVQKDFTWIATYAEYNCGLVVKADAPWKTLTEFLDYAKKNPGKVLCGNDGYGTGSQIMMALLAVKNGIEWKQIPISGGAKLATSLLGGHIHAWFASGLQALYIRDGSMRLLVSFFGKRSKLAPDVPTLEELGYEKLPTGRPMVIVGPAGIPDPVQKKLEVAFLKAMNEPGYLKFLDNVDFPYTFLDGRTTAKNIETNYKIWGEFIRLTGIKEKQE
jgi:tripartite-type tricarboxylate transporter receptor subunit TctC